MKRTAFLFIIFISCLPLSGRVCAVPDPDAPGTLLKIKTPEIRTGEPRLLANSIDTKDSVIYTTDPGMERAIRKEEREEREKENQSWEMLQHMYLYKNAGKHSPPYQPDNTPQQ